MRLINLLRSVGFRKAEDMIFTDLLPIIHARINGISIEMAARELRYKWFHEQMEEQKAQAIAIGHHMDDQAETLLLNLLRGTGLRGLAGMHPQHNSVVRPLLCVSRKDIEEYLRLHHLAYVTDSTNLQHDVLRNRIRLEVMPLLEQLQPAAKQTLSRAAQNVGNSLPYYIEGVSKAMACCGFKDDRLDIETYQENGCPLTLLHEWLYPYGFNTLQLSDIQQHLSGQAGKIWESPTHRLLRDRGHLLLVVKQEDTDEPVIEMNETSEIGPTGAEFAYVDADLITAPLVIRKVQNADWFVPFGMKGRKLLSDFLTNQKLSRFQKERQWVLCHGNDIVWVIGLRSDNRFRVTPQTKRIIQLRIKKNQPEQ
ncbi:MAG: tRNA lysidine(34) synthetase TilS, partial [Bacteroidaceae bacterium]|nr:tRNA lysidine(34) synthetase TilS [Bacteroidaceae bacterium]